MQWKYERQTGQTTPESSSIGQCKALYDFTPEQDDELTLKEGKWQLNRRLSEQYNSIEVYNIIKKIYNLQEIF